MRRKKTNATEPRHVVAKETFERVDVSVWSMLWRWATRRHPTKGFRWIKDRYFKSRGSRNWVFAATENNEDGSKRELVLLHEQDTPIQRHIKIKASANPHDPEWEQYFEIRWGKKMLNSPRGRGKLYRVWLQQDGQCSDCTEPITKGTPWSVRHTVKKAEGGSDAASNLQMHHLNCHRNRYHAKHEVV